MLIAPSILTADFGKLNEEITAICKANCDLIHIDVMDGHFVPNLTMGPVIVESIAKISTKPLDIHLMVQNNHFFVELFAPLKPKFLTFHIEEEKHANSLVQKIRNYGISPGIAINPHTSLESIYHLIEYVDMILIMSVNPGFGGQKFIPNILEKTKSLKTLIKKLNPKCLIEIDGGINDKNILDIKNSGVDIIVAGSYIFNADAKEYQAKIQSLRI